MNRAHSTHYTDRPEPGIKFVLRGWKEDGKPTDHDLNFQDVRVRSVATNIRDYYGGGGTERHGNSIFIFEVANLCIAHLGHLHHTLTSSSSTRSAASMSCWCRSTAARRSTSKA